MNGLNVHPKTNDDWTYLFPTCCLVSSVRKPWIFLASAGVVALIGVVGVGYGLPKPHQHRASLQVLLPQPPSSGTLTPESFATTQIAFATSEQVLTQAGQAATPVMTAAELKSHVSVKALSPQILQVAVSALSTSRAEKLADAVARDYIHMFENLPISVVGNTLPSVLVPATS